RADLFAMKLLQTALNYAKRIRGMKIAPRGPNTSTETGEKSHERSGERRAVPALTAGDRPGRRGSRDAQARPAGRGRSAPHRRGSAEALFITGTPRACRTF